MEEINRAVLKLEIPNFSEVLDNTRKDQAICSKPFILGGSKFALIVYPKGHQKAEQGMLSLSIQNESNHGVEVDCGITVDKGYSKFWANRKIEKKQEYGKHNFMRASEVRTDLVITLEVTLIWEEISGGMVQQNQINSSDLTKVEERLGEKLEQQQQQMKNFVRAEIAKVKALPVPECPVCLLKLAPPKKIVQCLKGHKICEPCSEKEEVVSCPTQMPHLQDCLHGEGLRHGGLHQGAFWGELGVLCDSFCMYSF